MTTSASPAVARLSPDVGDDRGGERSSARAARAIEWCARFSVHFAKSFVLTAFTYLVMLTGYQACKWEPFFAPHALPMTAIDRAIPFIPETVWAYGTVSYATLLLYLILKKPADARRLFVSLVVGSFFCTLVFALYPTIYPRELYPTPSGTSLTIQRLAELRDADSPANCMPSLHVVIATCLALFFAEKERHRALRVAGPIWAALVMFTTLTTKQHYLIDIPTGMVAGALGYGIARWAGKRGLPYWRSETRPLDPALGEDHASIDALLKNVEAHQWSLDDLALDAPGPALGRPMVRLLNHIIYIEEIAARNFKFLGQAARDPRIKRLYALFEDEEYRHAEGLRKILLSRGGWLERPGLGNALVLAQQPTLDPASDADAVLVAVSNPVFETFLDAGTIPFLRTHPALRSEAFDELVRRICKDEAAHIGLNWILSRQAARSRVRFRYLLNPAILRGMLAIPFMSLDVYALAHQLGFEFSTLRPPFSKLWRLHRRYPELASYPMWMVFRLFVVCGYVAVRVTHVLAKLRLLFIRFWTFFSRITDGIAWLFFGGALLEEQGLPYVDLIPRKGAAAAPRRSAR
ncbi:MAG: phosphatase PAP2 family protein [Polyangiaceae bacterium]